MMNFLLLLLNLFLVGQAFGTECFEFQLNGSPDKQLDEYENIRKEIWCYRALSDPEYETMIFNYDGEEITNDLGLLVAKNEKGEGVKFLYYDQLNGKTRIIEQIGLHFNPYQIPLSTIEVKNLIKNQGQVKKVTINFSDSQDQKIEQMVDQMIRSEKKTLDFSENSGINSINQDIGNEDVYLPDELLPTDGYWWPHNGVPLARPDHSPAHLYDQYVNSITGKNPKSREWEIKYHSLEHVPWGGHCNGWAASSILHGFYDKALILNLKNGQEDIVINPSDIQGMRVETSFCVKMAFYGTRYNGPKDDISDIKPEIFHKVLKYYLKELGKPIALDRYMDESVDNSIFSGYSMKVNKISENTYHVSVSAKTHYYNDNFVFLKSSSYNFYKSYSYVLFTDEKGNINGGNWAPNSEHPDFLWVPLAQMKCGRENPRMHHNYIEQMIKTLPKGTYKIDNLELTFTLNLAPNEAKKVRLNLERDYIESIRASSDWNYPVGTIKFVVEDEFGNESETKEKFSYKVTHNINAKKIKAMEVYNFSPYPKTIKIDLYQLNFMTEIQK